MRLNAIFLFMAVASLGQCQRHSQIIRDDIDGPNPDGSYKWAIETDEGIYHEQRGSVQEDTGLAVKGQYQYVAPDGQVINVLYSADENGFQASGAHLPTPPPVPPAIQKIIDYLNSHPTEPTRI
ncbi:endocuticle structural glycoprotein ABD-4 [Bombyx mori]|nr:cuticular protein RR-1 motif 51 precursor [Bombyx mori]XP_037875685.1 endocuticle structural glycoprotein ABD-4-like [Bombyx mori]FAA00554.1 TPA: putative cuticle protein [Bombyx mori]